MNFTIIRNVYYTCPNLWLQEKSCGMLWDHPPKPWEYKWSKQFWRLRCPGYKTDWGPFSGYPTVEASKWRLCSSEEVWVEDLKLGTGFVTRKGGCIAICLRLSRYDLYVWIRKCKIMWIQIILVIWKRPSMSCSQKQYPKRVRKFTWWISPGSKLTDTSSKLSHCK